ncbi:MAG: hypothetical protein HYZ30_01875 [Candidatus Azosocius agrarius]|nr:MAG: hypothetical protein HYZ30_01875 [Gammaproteobacteria bacterium]
MLRFFFLFSLFLSFNSNCMSVSKSLFYFGVEGSSVKNYFEIDLLPINFSTNNLLFLKKDKNENNKIILKEKMINVTKHFLSYLKEIKTSDFVFVNGISFFIGYKINNFLSINFGRGVFVNTLEIKVNNFNELFKNQLIDNYIGKYRYSYNSKWIDIFKFFLIEKKLCLLFSFGFEYSKSKFDFLSNKIYKSYKNDFIKEKNFDIKKFNFFNLLKKKKNEKDILMPYTLSYKKNKQVNLIKENVDINYSKIYMDHLLGLNFISNRKGFRLGVGFKCIISSNIYMNFIFRYHIFVDNYKYIKVLNRNLISTSFSVVYKL